MAQDSYIPSFVGNEFRMKECAEPFCVERGHLQICPCCKKCEMHCKCEVRK